MKRKRLTPILKSFIGIYIISTTVFCAAFITNAITEGKISESYLSEKISQTGGDINSKNFGIMCISSSYPGLEVSYTDSRDNEKQQNEEGNDGVVLLNGEEGTTEIVTSEVKENTEPIVLGKKPVVLILHTHATESYLPSSGGNYHKKGKINTVRDVGEILAKSLEQEGIALVHDQTLHDSPSYNKSYNRSYNTAEKIMKKYPTIKCVIDLHRDAVSADSAAAATVSVKGKKCAKYSYVVSNSVGTYKKNLNFIRAMNETAAEDYSGFTGKIIERGYRYNQNLSSRYMLLEIGYNRNEIDECRNTAVIFGKILAQTLKEGN